MGWEVDRTVPLAVPQASGVAVLGPDRFAVVDDERGIFVARADGSAERVIPRTEHEALRDLEGIGHGPDGSLLVVSERNGLVTRIERDGATLGAITVLGELEPIGKKRNKGWEGIAFLPAERGGPWILACHEAKPRRIGVFDPKDLRTEAILKPPKEVRRALDDFSDLCVEPATGHVYLLSDESRAFAELTLEGGALELVELTELDVGKKEKPEGLGFDDAGALWLVTDGDPHLRRLRRRG